MKASPIAVEPVNPDDEIVKDPYFSIRTVVEGPGVIPSSKHPYFEILLQLSGQRTQHLSMRDVALDEGGLVFMGQGVTHGATVHRDSVSLLIGFNLTFLCPELPVFAAATWGKPAVLETAPMLLPFAAQSNMDFRCDLQFTKRLREMGADLMAHSGSQRIGAKPYTRAALSLFLLSIVEYFEDGLVDAAVSSVSSQFGSERIDKLVLFIRDNLAEQISIDDAANHLNISPSCLAARVRRVTGKSFGDLLLEARLTRAKELLLYREDRISEVAYATGFDDHAYFCRRFRQFTGVTPSDYRRSRSGGGQNETAH